MNKIFSRILGILGILFLLISCDTFKAFSIEEEDSIDKAKSDSYEMKTVLLEITNLPESNENLTAKVILCVGSEYYSSIKIESIPSVNEIKVPCLPYYKSEIDVILYKENTPVYYNYINKSDFSNGNYYVMSEWFIYDEYMAGNIKKWEKEIKKENAVDIEFDKDIELSLLFEGDYALYKVGADQYLDITKSNQSYVSLYLSDDFDGLMDSKKQLNYYSNYHFSYIENESYLLIYANENDASVNVKFKSIKKDSAEKLEYGKDYECKFENAGDFKFYKVEEGQYLDIMTSNKSNVSLYLSDEFDRLNYSKKKVCDYSDYNISYIENESYLLIFANEKDASVNVKFKSIKEESAEKLEYEKDYELKFEKEYENKLFKLESGKYSKILINDKNDVALYYNSDFRKLRDNQIYIGYSSDSNSYCLGPEEDVYFLVEGTEDESSVTIRLEDFTEKYEHNLKAYSTSCISDKAAILKNEKSSYSYDFVAMDIETGEVTAIDQSENAGNPVFWDSNTLLFSSTSDLYKYSFETKTSELIREFPASIEGIYLYKGNIVLCFNNRFVIMDSNNLNGDFLFDEKTREKFKNMMVLEDKNLILVSEESSYWEYYIFDDNVVLLNSDYKSYWGGGIKERIGFEDRFINDSNKIYEFQITEDNKLSWTESNRHLTYDKDIKIMKDGFVSYQSSFFIFYDFSDKALGKSDNISCSENNFSISNDKTKLIYTEIIDYGNYGSFGYLYETKLHVMTKEDLTAIKY